MGWRVGRIRGIGSVAGRAVGVERLKALQHGIVLGGWLGFGRSLRFITGRRGNLNHLCLADSGGFAFGVAVGFQDHGRPLGFRDFFEGRGFRLLGVDRRLHSEREQKHAHP